MIYKKMQDFAGRNHLTKDVKKGLIYGMYQGYFLAIEQNQSVQAMHSIHFWVRPGRTAPSPGIADMLNTLAGKYKYVQSVSYSGHRVNVEFRGMGFSWGKNYIPMVENFLQEFTAYCRTNEVISCCETCDETESLSLYRIHDVPWLMCSECFGSYTQKEKEKNAEKKQEKGSVITGLVGALLGSLVGVAAWVVVYQLGYIAAVVGLIMVICTFKGYEKFGGKRNRTGVVLCTLLSVVMLLFAEQLSLAVELYQVFSEYYIMTFFDAFRMVPAVLAEESEVLTSVIGEMVIAYLLMFLGAFSVIRSAFRSASGQSDAVLICPVSTVAYQEKI